MHEGNALSEALRALPDPTPPEGLWDDITRRLNQEQAQTLTRRAPETVRRWVRWWVLPGLVVATSVALGVWLILERAPERPTGFLDPVVAELLMESQSLEALAHSSPAARSATRDVLLARIAHVDAMLNDAWLAESGGRNMEPLLQRRVALLHSLVDLRQRPATRYNPALRPAVLTGDDR